MSKDLEMPIVVTGMARSGTTWMQWFLSEHPRIHVHGQEPKLHWADFWEWYQKLVVHGQWARRSNRLQGYPIAHYAGSDPARCQEIFKRMFHQYMTGRGSIEKVSEGRAGGPPRCGRTGPAGSSSIASKPRCGLKWIGLAGRGCAPWQFVSIWPQTRWVLCVREPFAAMASLKNTFAPELDVGQYAAAWVATCKFIEAYDRGRLVVVQMDKLAGQPKAQRRAAMQEVLDCVGEEPSPETDRFVERWPVVHKVTPDEERPFRFTHDQKQHLLAGVPELAHYMEKMGYRP